MRKSERTREGKRSSANIENVLYVIIGIKCFLAHSHAITPTVSIPSTHHAIRRTRCYFIFFFVLYSVGEVREKDGRRNRFFLFFFSFEVVWQCAHTINKYHHPSFVINAILFVEYFSLFLTHLYHSYPMLLPFFSLHFCASVVVES